MGWWACVFFPTHIFSCNLRGSHCGEEVLKASLLRVCAARPGGLCAATLRCHGSDPLQAPLSGFSFFSEVTQKIRRALAQSFALSAFRLCKSAHAPLVPANWPHLLPPGLRCAFGSHEPGAGLRRPLMCCLLLAAALEDPVMRHLKVTA